MSLENNNRVNLPFLSQESFPNVMQDWHRYQWERTKQDAELRHTVTLSKELPMFCIPDFSVDVVLFNPPGSPFLLLFVIVHMLYVVVTVVSVCCYTYLQNCVCDSHSLPHRKEWSIWQEISIIVRQLRLVQKHFFNSRYRGADKSLARPERKQATATEDFDFHISYL